MPHTSAQPMLNLLIMASLPPSFEIYYYGKNIYNIKFLKIKFTTLTISTVYSAVVLSVFTLLSNQSPELFHLRKLDSIVNKKEIPHTPFPQPLTSTILPSVSMNLTAPDISHSQNHTVFFIFVAGLFHFHNVLKVHPCHRM